MPIFETVGTNIYIITGNIILLPISAYHGRDRPSYVVLSGIKSEFVNALINLDMAKPFMLLYTAKITKATFM